ncbi:unnamed protein product [Linum trigynum]|uniref:Cytochrome P450 n=1 Tax=Linum trigynum TaxID=586398 RepID=A0AAV2EEP1_9ROSI
MAVPLLLPVLLLLPILLVLLRHLRRKSSGLPPPPGPKGLPLIGNMHQLDHSNIGKYLWNLSKQYGPIMSLRIGLKPLLVVSSAKTAELVLRSQDLDFCGRASQAGQQKLSYNGLDLAFAPYTAYWREMRKICVVYLFNSNRVNSFRHIREDEVSQMIDTIAAAAGGGAVDLTAAMMGLTSTIICRIAFGKKLEGKEKRMFHKLFNETQFVFGSFFLSDYLPYMGWADKLTGLTARLDKNFREFDTFYQEIIERHLDPNRTAPQNENILDVLLGLYKDRSFKVKLEFEHIKAVLMNVFVGGTDTSAATVIWAMSFLMRNPEAMVKAQREIRDHVRGKGDGSDFVTEDDIPRLPYLNAVIKETFRVQPALPVLVPRETNHDCSLGGYEIAAGTIVYVNALAVGRDPEVWEDPLAFRPERFEGRKIDVKGLDYELIPFGAGRRICPGIHLGMAAVETALANLLYRFDWKTPAGMKPEDINVDRVLPGIVVAKADPLCLVPTDYLGGINK